MCEVLIQGYYCVKHFTPVIHCLTDLSDWHYFMLGYNPGEDCLKITWTYSFSDVNLSQEHLTFLYGAVKPILNSITIKNTLVQATTSTS